MHPCRTFVDEEPGDRLLFIHMQVFQTSCFELSRTRIEELQVGMAKSPQLNLPPFLHFCHYTGPENIDIDN